ncbi:MAG: alpha-glucan family phosphorylase [Chitinophagaceae bacterium]|jgi:starch phosphorylase|nr:alpha-glucan family phosphorylase [Chitinophagaceae bacterium]
MPFELTFPYAIDQRYSKRVAYFCMEYGIDQPLKTYAGGLGFLAGSHLRSAWQLKQAFVAIGVLWKYGYYDQVRKQDQTMDVFFMEKVYGFLQDTGIRLTITVSDHPVKVAAYYLPPTVFQTAPLFLLSTDLPENDYLAQTICHHLYDANPETRAAAAILLGEGGAKLLEILQWQPDIYHLNESHGLPLAFYLYNQLRSADLLKKKLVFTNHTPEPGGNERIQTGLLHKLGYCNGLSAELVRSVSHTENGVMDLTLTALKLAGRANGVSARHGRYLQSIRSTDSCPTIAITNAQDFSYWHHAAMYQALQNHDDGALLSEKARGKKQLFELVADQCGEIYNEHVLTIVFAKRFTGYKRPALLLNDMQRLHLLLTNADRPVQLIWAGKPYPMDYTAIATFDKLVHLTKSYPNCCVLTGYEMKLSRLLKQGADVWLNVPRLGHEASGTSGMSAAMNGALNVSIPDGWFPEFAQDGINSFVINPTDPSLPEHIQDENDANELFEILEKRVIPLYYNDQGAWLSMIRHSMEDIRPAFDSLRMADEYYTRLYCD